MNFVFMSSTLYRDPQTQKAVKAIINSGINAKVSLIIGDKEKEDAHSKQWAKKHRIPIVFIETKGKTIGETDSAIIAEIEKHGGDYVFLIGWMKFLGPIFLKKFKDKALNIHPSLLPAFPKLMDWQVHKAVIAAGVKISGCTLHFVNKKVDGGPIILQKTVPVIITDNDTSDTAASLRKKVQRMEIKVMVKAAKLLVENEIQVKNNKVIILNKTQTAN